MMSFGQQLEDKNAKQCTRQQAQGEPKKNAPVDMLIKKSGPGATADNHNRGIDRNDIGGFDKGGQYSEEKHPSSHAHHAAYDGAEEHGYCQKNQGKQ